MTLTEVTQKLANAKVPYSVWFTTKTTDHWTISISDSLNNDQLKVATDLGGSLEPNGKVFLIGRGF